MICVLTLLQREPAAVSAERPAAERVSPVAWATAFEPNAVRSRVPASASFAVIAVGGGADTRTAARALMTSLRRAGLEVRLAPPMAVAPDADTIKQTSSEGETVVVIQTFGQPVEAAVTVFAADGSRLSSFTALAGTPLEVQYEPNRELRSESVPPIAPVPTPNTQPAADGLLLKARFVNGVEHRSTVVLNQQVGTLSGSSSLGTTVAGQFYRQVCTLPCSKRIDTRQGTVFFVDGDEITSSEAFYLPESGVAEIDVRPGNAARHFGWVFGGSFVASVATGGGVTLAILAEDPRVRNGGIALSVAGAGLLVTSIVLAIRNRTRVTVSTR